MADSSSLPTSNFTLQTFGGTPAAHWAFVQNEPNFRRGRAGRGPRGEGRRANVQNEPNFALSGTCGSESTGESRAPDAQPTKSRMVQNKANSTQVSGRASTWWEKSYGESHQSSQFASDRPQEKAGAALWLAESLKALRVPPRTRRRSRLRGCEGGSRPLR
jgi:hypothetical protein